MAHKPPVSHPIVIIPFENQPQEAYNGLFSRLFSMVDKEKEKALYEHLLVIYHYYCTFNKIQQRLTDIITIDVANRLIDNNILLMMDNRKTYDMNEMDYSHVRGFISYYKGIDSIYLSRIFVDENNRRQNLAISMLYGLIEYAKTSNIIKIKADVEPTEHALRLFTKANYAFIPDNRILSFDNAMILSNEMRDLIINKKYEEVLTNEKYSIMKNTDNTYPVLCGSNQLTIHK